ncbi:unnamed protein product, partial [Mycena citricolor]
GILSLTINNATAQSQFSLSLTECAEFISPLKSDDSCQPAPAAAELGRDPDVPRAARHGAAGADRGTAVRRVTLPDNCVPGLLLRT